MVVEQSGSRKRLRARRGHLGRRGTRDNYRRVLDRELVRRHCVATADRSQIPGLYRLSFTAASACSALPDWARHREYDATIDQPREANAAGALLVLTVQLQPGFAPRFEGLLKGSRVSFWFPTDEPYSYGDGDTDLCRADRRCQALHGHRERKRHEDR